MTRIPSSTSGLVLALVLLLARSGAASGSATTPTMTSVDSVRADGELIWVIDYQLHNRMTTGFFPDSFFADFEDRDATQMRSPRRFTERLDALLKGILPLSGGDSITATYLVPSRFETGRVTLRMYGHTSTSSQSLPALTSSVELRPGPYHAAYPSEWVPVGGRKVELVPFAPGNPENKVPGILYVHNESAHARRGLATARFLHGRGYAVMLVSMPGFGASEGPADWCGPATQAAMETALRKLAQLPGVDPTRLAVWGQGRGATAAALLAAAEPKVRAVVLEGATYDLAASWRASTPDERALIDAEAGSDSSKWKSRSVLANARRIRTPVVLFHGEEDRLAPASSAHNFEAALRAGSTPVEAHYFAGRGSDLPPGSVRTQSMLFLRTHLNP